MKSNNTKKSSPFTRLLACILGVILLQLIPQADADDERRGLFYNLRERRVAAQQTEQVRPGAVVDRRRSTSQRVTRDRFLTEVTTTETVTIEAVTRRAESVPARTAPSRCRHEYPQDGTATCEAPAPILREEALVRPSRQSREVMDETVAALEAIARERAARDRTNGRSPYRATATGQVQSAEVIHRGLDLTALVEAD